MTTRIAASLALAATATLVASASTAHADGAAPAARLDLRAPRTAAQLSLDVAPAPAPANQARVVADVGGKKSALAAFSLTLAGAVAAPFVAWGAAEAASPERLGLVWSTRETAAFAIVGGIAPSVGHLYAGEYRHAIITSSIRAAGLSMVPALMISPDLVKAGLTVAAAATLYDLIDAPRAARRHNKRLAARQLTVAPMPVKGGGGMAVGGSF